MVNFSHMSSETTRRMETHGMSTTVDYRQSIHPHCLHFTTKKKLSKLELFWRGTTMFSAYQRISNLSALLSTCLLCLVGAISVSSFFFSADPKGVLSISNVNVHPSQNTHYRQRNHEYGFARFNVSAGTYYSSHITSLLYFSNSINIKIRTFSS